MNTYRILANSELVRYADFLKQRDASSLHVYFGYAISHDSIDVLVADMCQRPTDNHIVAALDQDLAIIGTVHIAQMSAQQVEFGVMVAENHRKQGHADRMMDYAITWCRNRGISDLYMHCLSTNAPIRHLVRKNGLTITQQGPETDAQLRLPPTDFFAWGHELALIQQNAMAETIMSFTRALR